MMDSMNAMDSMQVVVGGVGAVSPAGWGVGVLCEAVRTGGASLPAATEVPRPPRGRPLRHRGVPAPGVRPAWMAHPRLRRASSISVYTVAAAFEALGPSKMEACRSGGCRLGVILTVMTGSVIYSRRFYDEVLREPLTASPALFPETVFNAPASHLGAVLGTPAINYTLVGDPSVFLEGLAVGAGWLVDGRVDAVVVVGAEEPDWLTAEAWEPFARQVPLSGGAGAVLLERRDAGGAVGDIRLTQVAESRAHAGGREQGAALRAVRAELSASGIPEDGWLVDGLSGWRARDAIERGVWADWKGPRCSPLSVLGEGLAAGAAWQMAMAVSAVSEGAASEAWVSVPGINQAAAGARLARLGFSRE